MDELQGPGAVLMWLCRMRGWSIVQVVLAVGGVEGAGRPGLVQYRRKGPAFVKWALGWTFTSSICGLLSVSMLLKLLFDGPR